MARIEIGEIGEVSKEEAKNLRWLQRKRKTDEEKSPMELLCERVLASIENSESGVVRIEFESYHFSEAKRKAEQIACQLVQTARKMQSPLQTKIDYKTSGKKAHLYLRRAGIN